MLAETKTARQAEVKAVIYCRVSSLAQMKRGHGVQSQESRCQEFARAKGYAVDRVFSDDGVTGGMIDRPGMTAMLDYLREQTPFAEYVVLIDDISRLARDIRAHLELRSAISEAGGRLESPSVEFGEDSDSILVENLLASVSQHQRQKNAEQTRNRMRARVANGYWPFARPAGYRHQATPGEGKLLVREEPLASIIQEGLEGFAAGRFQIQAEVKRFFESHAAFPRDTRSGYVRNQFVNDILTNPLYAGYVQSPKWGISLRKGRHEGLISFETFERIQKRLKEGARAPARSDIREEFPLRGIVACHCCGHPLTGYWARSRDGTAIHTICATRRAASVIANPSAVRRWKMTSRRCWGNSRHRPNCLNWREPCSRTHGISELPRPRHWRATANARLLRSISKLRDWWTVLSMPAVKPLPRRWR